MPWIDSQVFERLQSGSRAVIMPRGEHLQPLLSLVDVGVALAALDRASMRASLKNTLRTVPNEIITFVDSNCFRNVNSPSDLN
jgi:molybdopterin-guanine dinucleotide biosynthesis protein A